MKKQKEMRDKERGPTTYRDMNVQLPRLALDDGDVPGAEDYNILKKQRVKNSNITTQQQPPKFKQQMNTPNVTVEDQSMPDQEQANKLNQVQFLAQNNH